MHGAQPVSQSDDGGTKRFRAKRDAILAAAAETINAQSAKGMTFADVARRVGLNTTSVTYYFKRKDDLAAACFEHTLDTLMAMLDEVGDWPAEFFFAHEETDLAWRAADAGWRILYAPELRLRHPKTPPARHAIYYRVNARNRVWLARRRLPLALVPVHLGVW
ncbi:TetR family transcriptional regulator, partial [Paenibacillus sp. GCM10023248]|uniref:TetR family transcriptional regulator n=1 Tax=unclassified Paenibacillus TaxID=185978 RepID=UPI002379CE97